MRKPADSEERAANVNGQESTERFSHVGRWTQLPFICRTAQCTCHPVPVILGTGAAMVDGGPLTGWLQEGTQADGAQADREAGAERAGLPHGGSWLGGFLVADDPPGVQQHLTLDASCGHRCSALPGAGPDPTHLCSCPHRTTRLQDAGKAEARAPAHRPPAHRPPNFSPLLYQQGRNPTSPSNVK